MYVNKYQLVCHRKFYSYKATLESVYVGNDVTDGGLGYFSKGIDVNIAVGCPYTIKRGFVLPRAIMASEIENNIEAGSLVANINKSFEVNISQLSDCGINRSYLMLLENGVIIDTVISMVPLNSFIPEIIDNDKIEIILSNKNSPYKPPYAVDVTANITIQKL